MNYHITLLEGDGIGPEVIGAAVKILDATGVNIKWDKALAGQEAIEKHGEPVPDVTIDAIKNSKVALKGPLTTPVGGGFRSANVSLRQKLDLYACVRPVVNLPGIVTRFSDVDLIVVRENTEGLYSGLEHSVVPGVVTSLKIISRNACNRIAEYAFDYCRHHGRRKVTSVHKAAVMKKSDGLFLEEVRKVSESYPFIEYEEMSIDTLAKRLVMDPSKFDVLVMGNLYGDIISDLSSGLVGGLGVVPGANIGNQYAVFEPVHGSAPDIAGKDLSNPLAAILSTVLMLEYIGEKSIADRIKLAVNKVLDEGKSMTKDLGGNAGTTEFTEAILAKL